MPYHYNVAAGIACYRLGYKVGLLKLGYDVVVKVVIIVVVVVVLALYGSITTHRKYKGTSSMNCRER